MKYVIFAAFIMIAMVMVASEEEEAQVCSPWGSLCHQTSDCCRGLLCATYTAKCVPINGIALPGMDTRPLGPGPYPPNLKL